MTASKLPFPAILELAERDDTACAEALARFRDPELVGELMVALYRTKTPAALAALEPLLREPFERGRWQGFKRIYKLAEADHDAATWCLQALVLDRRSYGWPVSQRTIAYLQRRSYRHLKSVAERRDELLYEYLEALLPGLEEREASPLLRRVLRSDDPGFGVVEAGAGFRASEVREGPEGEAAEAADEEEIRALLDFDDADLTKSSADLEPVSREPAPEGDGEGEEPAFTGWRGPVFPEAWVQDPARLLALLARVQHRQSAGALAQLLQEQAGEALWSQPLEPFYALLEHPVASVWRMALGQLAGRARQDLLRFDALTPLLTRVAASADWPVISDLLYVLEDERALEARASVAEPLVALARSRRDDPGVGGVVDFVRRHYPERIGPPLFDAAAALALLGARRPDVRNLGREALERVAAGGGLFPGHLEALLETALPSDAPDLTRALLAGREAPPLPALLDEVRPELCAQVLASAPEAGFQALRGALLAREEAARGAPAREGAKRLLQESLPGVLVASRERRVRRLGLDLLGGALERGELELLEVTELLRTSTEDVVVWVREALAAAAAEGRLGNEALYRMLDAVQADVRGFGRGLVQEHLARFEVAELVCFCAESPDAPTAALGLELYRERLRGQGDYDLAQLLPMFRILLFKVAQARAEKERLYRLLREWALEREENARLTVAVVAGFRRTHAKIDLSRALTLLARIRVRYPELELPFGTSATFGHVLAAGGGA